MFRKLQTEDAKNLYELNLDPDVIRYTGDQPFSSIVEAEDFIINYTAYTDYGIGRWAVIHKKTREFLGFCGLKYHPDENIVEIGFRFFKRYWNQGYATEAGKGAIAYGFTIMGYKEIYAHVHQNNDASKRVLEKIGLTFQKEIIYDGVPAFLYKIEKT
nr:GNAT family N-acetyltransferase [Aquimarina sp. MMG016]